MTPQEFSERMKKAINEGDVETGHINADKLMCALLRQLGYEAGVEQFEEMAKWYA